MFITFKKRAQGAGLHLEYELKANELYHESPSYQVFIDSNLPVATLRDLCQQAESEGLGSLQTYLKQDGVLLVYDKTSGEILVQRDASGLASIHYYITEEELLFSSNVHAIAGRRKLPLLKASVMQWLTFDFLWDGQTLYEGTRQVLVDQRLKFDRGLRQIQENWEPLLFAKGENHLTEEENTRRLRKEIVKAHELYLREKNVVFLSGGIDSVAMLIALDDLVDKDRIENHSFRVKGTEEDETVYARSIADHLHTPLKIIERDLSGEITPAALKEKILAMDNPYPGIWIFANQVNADPKNIYYAGQDTRLHTPSLNAVDKLAFAYFAATHRLGLLAGLLDLLMWPARLFFGALTRLSFFKKRAFVGFKRAAHLTNTRRYVERYYFKQDKSYYLDMGLPEVFYETASANYSVDLKGISSRRELYNYIVARKWKEQYVNDIRYMVDMVKEQGGRLAMPFYNRTLTGFSATIPFGLANKAIKGKGPFSDKKVMINKFVLRQSLRDKIDDKTYYRAKAVSSTFHIIYNQALSPLLRQIIRDDLAHPRSIIRQLDLHAFIHYFQSSGQPFQIGDGPYLLKIYYLCCVILYAEVSDNRLV